MKRHNQLRFFFLTCLGITLSFSGVILPSVSASARSTSLYLTATPLPDPLATPLAAPGPDPVSAWRPPLYPVPWALTEHDHFFFIRPIAADEVNWPLSVYRYAGTNFGPDLAHTGVDIVTPEGTPVIAAAAGKVVWAGYGVLLGSDDPSDPYGLAIAIQHDFGLDNKRLFTVYAHLSHVGVERGQQVEMGEVIGLSGETGAATAPHLHFEVRWGLNDFFSTYNPELWMAPPQGWGVLAGRLTTTLGEPVNNVEIRVTNLETGQRWFAKSYGTLETINRDPYYRENLVLSDLPAGHYQIFAPYQGRDNFLTVYIYPGAVTFFRLQGFNGLNTNPPIIALPSNIPIEPTATP